MILGAPDKLAAGLIPAGSLLLVAMMIVMVRGQTALYTLVMAIGGGCWLAGNLLWLYGLPIYRVAPFWAVFLVLTIAGERLELGRILRLSRRKIVLFAALVGLVLLGLAGSLVSFDPGVRAMGLGFLGMAAWLLWNDIARKTIRGKGLVRFIAACLLSGFIWLGVGGLFYAAFGGVAAGLQYDAALHAIFLGFVMAMIFAHTPIIFPAVLDRPIRYSFILLQLSGAVGILAAAPRGRGFDGELRPAALGWPVERDRDPDFPGCYRVLPVTERAGTHHYAGSIIPSNLEPGQTEAVQVPTMTETLNRRDF